MSAPDVLKRERGAATILLIAVLLPLFLLLLTATVEMNSFVAQRQLVQETLDVVSRKLLRSVSRAGDVNRVVQERLKKSSAFVQVRNLSSYRTPTQATVKGEFFYTTTFAGIYPALKSGEALNIPFDLSSRISRTPYDVLLLTDRSIQNGEDRCASTTLKSINLFSSSLYSSAQLNGATTIIAGVLDPIESAVVRLDAPASEKNNGLLCSGDVGYVDIKDALASIKGVSRYPADPYAFINSIQETLFQDRSKTPTRKQIIFLVTRGFDDRWKALGEINSELQKNAQSAGLVVSLTRVIVGEPSSTPPSCMNEWKSITSPNFSSKCLSVRSEAHLDGTLLTALMSDTGEAVLER